MDVDKRRRYSGIGFFGVAFLFLVVAVMSFATGTFLMSVGWAVTAIAFAATGVLILRQN